MAYCTIDDLRRILPEKVNIGDDNIGTPSPGRTSIKRSNISTKHARYYIEYAQQYVDARLRPFYLCPLRRVKSFETELDQIASAGSNSVVVVRDAGVFSLGELVRLQDKSGYENAIVSEVIDFNSFKVDNLSNTYTPDGGKVSIVEYPDPIPLVAARMACSYILDRLFTSEQSPDVSTYGKTMRNLAREAIDDILTGEALLFGQEHTGRRFVRGSLFDAYGSPVEIQKAVGRE